MLGSVGLAIYGLIVYLYNFHNDIKHYSPVWKFLSVKIALFLSIWQRLVLKGLQVRKLIVLDPDQEHIDSEDLIDNLLVTLEMFILSLIVRNCYSYEDFKTGIKEERERHSRGILTIPHVL